MTGAVSRNYARALFELVDEPGARDETEAGLRAARRTLYDDREVRSFLANRLIGRPTKKSVVRVAFGGEVDHRLLTLLYLLIDRGRTVLLAEIAEEFERLCRLARGVRKVTVLSAFPLEEEERRRLTRAFEAQLQAAVELEVQLRPSLIGGVVAMSEGREIDFSIEGRLKGFADRLRRSAGCN